MLVKPQKESVETQTWKRFKLTLADGSNTDIPEVKELSAKEMIQRLPLLKSLVAGITQEETLTLNIGIPPTQATIESLWTPI